MVPLHTFIRQQASSAALERLEQFLEDEQALLIRKRIKEPDDQNAFTILQKQPVQGSIATLADDLRLKTNVVTQEEGKVRVTAERPSPDTNPEIESIRATGSTSSGEDTESIETVILQNTPRTVRPYKKTTAINSDDTRK